MSPRLNTIISTCKEKQKNQRAFAANATNARTRLNGKQEAVTAQDKADSHMVMAHDRYAGGDRSVKDSILDLWQKDKTCGWITSFAGCSGDSWQESKKTKSGWISRHAISMDLWNAKAADRPEDDSDLLKDILNNCEKDQDWDEKYPYEKAMKARGEWRYKWVNKALTEEENKKFASMQENRHLNKEGTLH